MIGSIPSYSDQHQYLSDEHLYPQQLNTMYGAPTASYPNYNTAEQPRTTYVPGQSQTPLQYDQPYDGQNLHNGQQPTIDFRRGSFADVGAAFGYNPDLPIQLTSQQLSQGTTMQPRYDPSFPNHNSYNNINPNQQIFGSLPLPDVGPTAYPAWSRSDQNNHQKRTRPNPDDTDEDGDQYGTQRPTRLPGACIHCKNLKVKCEFSHGQDVCNRCRAGKKECRVMGRKPRRPPPKREDLLKQIRDQEAMIKDLRNQLEAAHLSPPRQQSSGLSGESALSPSSAHSPEDFREPSVPKNIQEWIDEARVSADTTGDLNPDATPDPLSDVEGDEDADDDYVGGEAFDHAVSPGLSARGGDGGGLSVIRSPAVGTTMSPIGVLAGAALRRERSGTKRRESTTSLSPEEDKRVGLANPSYFMPGVSTNPSLRWAIRESQPPPKIFSRGLVSPREVDKLFEIYFEKMNLAVSLLDPEIYTAQTTYWRSPFLFTVICAIASRYLDSRPDLYGELMNFAKLEAGQALVSGLKSVELVAGYILLSLYPVPSTRWEEDRGWLMLGVAIRMATDLNLHQAFTAKATTEAQRREIANRARIWINCYNVDRSTSTQFGKPSTIKEDYIARNLKFWYRTTGFSYDIHLCSYSQILSIMAKFHEAIYSNPDHPSGLNMSCDFEQITKTYEQKLLDCWQEWEPILAKEGDKQLHCLYRIELLRLANAYSRLVILSFRFQNAFQKGLSRGDPFLQRCLDTASEVVKVVVDNMAPHPFLRTAPDAQFVFASFASVFLLKLLRPRFSSVLEPRQREDIISLIGRLISVLQSDEVAIDERHAPKLYARFLQNLLECRASHYRSSTGGSIQSTESSQVGEFTIIVEEPQGMPEIPQEPQELQDIHQYPLYHMPGAGDPSLTVPSSSSSYINDGASTISDTIAAPSHVSAEVPESVDFNFNLDDAMLAPMRVVANPAFWEDMMMPGFNWTPTAEINPAPDFFQQFTTPVGSI